MLGQNRDKQINGSHQKPRQQANKYKKLEMTQDFTWKLFWKKTTEAHDTNSLNQRVLQIQEITILNSTLPYTLAILRKKSKI